MCLLRTIPSGFRCAAALTVATVALVGCNSAPPTAQLEGNVTIDGKPVPKGYLQFHPKGPGQVVQAEIEDGSYFAPNVPLGPNTVRIMAQRETGKMVQVMGSTIPETINILPAKYATAGIAIDVAGSDPARHFELTSR